MTEDKEKSFHLPSSLHRGYFVRVGSGTYSLLLPETVPPGVDRPRLGPDDPSVRVVVWSPPVNRHTHVSWKTPEVYLPQ